MTTAPLRAAVASLIGACLLTTSGCQILKPQEDRWPARPSPITVISELNAAPVGVYVSVTVSISFTLSANNVNDKFTGGPTTVGFCLIASDHLLETARCNKDTVFTAPVNVSLHDSQPLQSTSDLVVHRGETVTLSHTAELTLPEAGGVTVIGVFAYSSHGGPSPYGELIHGIATDPVGRVFIEFR